MRKPAIVLLMLLTFIFCGKNEQTYTVETIDGVKYVHNVLPEWGNKQKLKLDFVYKIGGLDEDDDKYQLFMAVESMLDKEGNLYVMDSGTFRIQVYDPEGKYLRTIGKKGQGPGEFQNLFSMDMDKNGVLYIIDGISDRINQFDKGGKFITSTKIKSLYSHVRMTGPDKFFSPIINAKNKIKFPDLWYSSAKGKGRKDAKELKCINLVSISDKTIKEFCKGIPETEGLDNGIQLNAVIFETDEYNNLYVTFKHQNRIEKYSPEGGLLLSIDRSLDYQIEYGTADQIWTNGGGKAMKVPEFAGTFVSGKIGIDRKDRIWVDTNTSQPEKDEHQKITKYGRKVFEVFSPEGVLLTKVQHPGENLVFVKLQGDQLLFADKDYLSIHKYRIADIKE